MTKSEWLWHRRYELSGDGIGLLKYITRNTYYHIHSNEMNRLERWRWRVLKRLKGKVRFA